MTKTLTSTQKALAEAQAKAAAPAPSTTSDEGVSTYAIAYYQGDRKRLQVVGINTPQAHTLRLTEALASRRQSTNFKEMCDYARELAQKHRCEYVPHLNEEPDYLD